MGVRIETYLACERPTGNCGERSLAGITAKNKRRFPRSSESYKIPHHPNQLISPVNDVVTRRTKTDPRNLFRVNRSESTTIIQLFLVQSRPPTPPHPGSVAPGACVVCVYGLAVMNRISQPTLQYLAIAVRWQLQTKEACVGHR